MKTVDRACKNLGGRSLTGSPCSAEEIGMSDLTVFDLVLQGSDNCSLSDDLIEVLRTVFPIECQISHFLLLR